MRLKKVISFFLAAVLTLSALTISVGAENTEIFKVEVEAMTTTSTVSNLPIIYNQGEKITVKLSASQNTGITALKLHIDYDEDLLEMVDGKFKTLNLFTSNDEITQKTTKNGDEYFIFYSDNYPNVSTNTGTFAEITFIVKQACTKKSAVTVTTYQNSAGNCQVQTVSGLNPVPFESQSDSFSIHKIDPALGVITKPTCTEQGYTTYVCACCEESVVGNIVSATGHTSGNAVEENRINPTCTEDGSYDSVVYCSVCNEELSRENKIINALGHDLIHHEAKDATCTEIGWGVYDTCSRCDYTTYKEIHSLGHNPTVTKEENRVEATCISDGSYDSVVYCSVCDEELSRETITLNKLGHDLIHHEAKDATCTEIGWEAYDTCSRCDYTTYKEIHSLGHNPTVTKEENRVEATCISDGSYDSVVYCSVCDEELSRETITLNKLGHDLIHHDAKDATCTEIGWDVYDTCSRCDYTTYVEISALGHKFDGDCDKECNNCDNTREAPDHVYDDVLDAVCNVCNYIREITFTGWYSDGADWYYYENGNMVKNEWRQDSVGWVYLGSSGAMLTNAWCTDSQGWCYVGADGYAVTNCWKQDSIGWCYLGANGSQVKNNWVLDGGLWYFINADGYMVSNCWKQDSKGWVYLGSSGAMLTNAWCTDSQGWCYVGADGYAVTNCWKQDSIGWCYLGANGSQVKNNWVLDGGNWYYLDANGYMLSNTSRYITNKTYYFNASGVCTNP